jgi:hypothetical protein
MSNGPLRCVLCSGHFTREDVENYNYFEQTSTCFNCYHSKFAKAPYQGPGASCFGKKNLISESGKVIGYGYDPMASSDCRETCPHRHICKIFQSKKVYRIRQFLMTPFTGEIAKAMQALLRGVSRIKGKTILRNKNVRKAILRGFKDGKRWNIVRTSKAYRAYWLKEKKS